MIEKYVVQVWKNDNDGPPTYLMTDVSGDVGFVDNPIFASSFNEGEAEEYAEEFNDYDDHKLPYREYANCVAVPFDEAYAAYKEPYNPEDHMDDHDEYFAGRDTY